MSRAVNEFLDIVRGTKTQEQTHRFKATFDIFCEGCGKITPHLLRKTGKYEEYICTTPGCHCVQNYRVG